MTQVDSNARFWDDAGRKLARRVNFGWWLSGWVGWCMAAGLGGSIATLLVRTLSDWDFRWAWIASGGLLLIGCVIALVGIQRRAETLETARVRLEDALALRARLTSAAAGVGAWPEPRTPLRLPVHVRWLRPIGVLAFSLLMLGLASYIPISRAHGSPKRIIEKPVAAQEVARWVDQLRQKQAASEESLKEVENKLNELLQRPADHWYEQSNLEAASSLRDTTAENLREMARNMAAAERASNALSKLGGSLPKEAQESLAKTLQNSLNGLRSGDMQASDSLQQQMQGDSAQGDVNPDGLSGMSQEQLDKLAQKLRDAMKALDEALANSPDVHLKEMAGPPDSDKERRGGRPGKDEGSEHKETPLTTKREPTDLSTDEREKLKAKPDFDHLAPGDVLKITDGKHHVDEKTYQGPVQSGAASSLGEGGGAVWQNSLVPEEREALKKYFK